MKEGNRRPAQATTAEVEVPRSLFSVLVLLSIKGQYEADVAPFLFA